MSHDVYFQRFVDGEPAPGGCQRMREVLEPFIVRSDPQRRYSRVEYGDGAADVYLGTESMLANNVTGEQPWDLLVSGARAAGWVITPAGAPVCITDESQSAHLPEDLSGEVELVHTGKDLLDVVQGR